MNFKQIELRGGDWFGRWEAMMNAYVPDRLERFDLMLKWAGLPRDRDAHILARVSYL